MEEQTPRENGAFLRHRLTLKAKKDKFVKL